MNRIPTLGARPARWLATAVAGLVAAVATVAATAAETPTPPPTAATGTITVLAAASSTPAVREAARLFAAETGIKVECSFAGTGTLLNQIRTEHIGDLFIPASDDFLDKAEAEGLVDRGTRCVLVRQVPVICVQKGNPKKITSLKDLTRPGLRIALADPKVATIGAIAKAAMDAAGVYGAVRPQIVTFATDVQQAVSLVRLKEVDAAFGYDVSQRQSADLLDAVPFEGAKAIAVPVAPVAFSKQKALAQRFVDYLSGPRGREVFARHGYTLDKP